MDLRILSCKRENPFLSVSVYSIASGHIQSFHEESYSSYHIHYEVYGNYKSL